MSCRNPLQLVDVTTPDCRVLQHGDEGTGMTLLADQATTKVEFQTSPERYRHWRLATDGELATLTLTVDEDGGLVPGYALKMNSYDLGVDIELYDAVQRLRFEHPADAVVARFSLEVTRDSGEKLAAHGLTYYRLADGRITLDDPFTRPDLAQLLGMVPPAP